MEKIDLNDAIVRGRIISFADGPKLVKKEMNSAKEDLMEAQKTFSMKGYKWATVQAYYSMFHSARAMLYAKSYREKSHFYLGKAVAALYMENGQFTQEYCDNFAQGMNLRELADYKSKFSKEGADRIIDAAKQNLSKTKRILRIKP
jgi:uncharacterized protein (UPF0332 family)